MVKEVKGFDVLLNSLKQKEVVRKERLTIQQTTEADLLSRRFKNEKNKEV